MKRDMEIIRAILLKVEEKCQPCEYERFSSADFPEFDWQTVWAHHRLIEDFGLFQGVSQELGMNDFSVDGLSWKGFEFLDRIRDPAVWKLIKSGGVKVGNLSIDSITTLSKKYVEKKANEFFGLELGKGSN